MIKMIKRIWLLFLSNIPGIFGWYDVYFNDRYQGTVLAFGSTHALDQVAKQNAYLRDSGGLAISINPDWKTKLNSIPGNLKIAKQTPFKLNHLSLDAKM